MDKSAIRDAATVIVMRERSGDDPSVLMGQRGKTAAFMPGKFVFPGGAVDPADHDVALVRGLAEPCRTRLTEQAAPNIAPALAVAAIRELWEETGLVIGRLGTWPGPPPDWVSYAATGHLPDASGLSFVFRAITPPGRPRRFDARFFLADVGAIRGSADDFSRASDELSHLQWIPLSKVRGFDLPFITQVVLAEIGASGRTQDPPATVPFFNNNDEGSLFQRLGGSA